MKRNTLARLAILAVLASGAGWVPAAQAKPKAEKVKPGTALDAAALRAELESGDEARMLAALERVAEAREAAKALTPDVEALLRRGASAKVVGAALTAAGALRQESSSAAVAPYLRHRDEGLRRGAARALVKTGGAAAVKALRAALRSPDAGVRGVAASGLGALGAREALPDLFTALDRRVDEAATSVGQLCEPEECEKFAARLGKLPFDVMTSGFDQILFRAPDKMSDDAKLRIVGRLRELGTAEAGKFLADVAGRWPAGWSKHVKQAIDAAVKATGGGAEADD